MYLGIINIYHIFQGLKMLIVLLAKYLLIKYRFIHQYVRHCTGSHIRDKTGYTPEAKRHIPSKCFSGISSLQFWCVAITDRLQAMIFKQDIEGAWWLEIITVCSENPHCGSVPTKQIESGCKVWWPKIMCLRN